jgi:tol-pal system protein YbgF
MRKQLSYTGLLLLTALHAQPSAARDVQMRPTFDSEGNSVATSNTVANTNTSNLSTEERLQRLERMLNSQGLVDMLLRLDSLQNELQALRGELELHTHQLEEIKQRQRDLYVDIDRRLLQLERNGQVSGGPVLTPQSTTTPSTPTSAGTSAPVPVTATSSADEQKQYQKAFDLLRELRYEQAVKAFRDFLAQFPNGRYAHIAQYWIGEANYAQRNFQQAIGDYQKLISDHPNSPKLAEAMLKIGYSQYELKKYKDAEKSLNTLIKSYPGTTEASQAKNLLTQIRLKRGG